MYHIKQQSLANSSALGNPLPGGGIPPPPLFVGSPPNIDKNPFPSSLPSIPGATSLIISSGGDPCSLI